MVTHTISVVKNNITLYMLSILFVQVGNDNIGTKVIGICNFKYLTSVIGVKGYEKYFHSRILEYTALLINVLNWTFMFKWYMNNACGQKGKYKTITIHDEIGLCVQETYIVLDSIFSISWEDLWSRVKRKVFIIFAIHLTRAIQLQF